MSDAAEYVAELRATVEREAARLAEVRTDAVERRPAKGGWSAN